MSIRLWGRSEPGEPTGGSAGGRGTREERLPARAGFAAGEPTNVLYLTTDDGEGRFVGGGASFAHHHLRLELSHDVGAALRMVAEAGRYDALVIGWSVPEEEGLAILQRLRARRQRPAVVAVGKQSLDRYREAGADGTLEKTHAFLSRLPSVIEEAMRAKRALATLKAAPRQGLRVAFAGGLERAGGELAAAGSSLRLLPLPEMLRDVDARQGDEPAGFDLVVIDEGDAGSDTTALLGDVRARNLGVPVVLLVEPSREQAALETFHSTVDECVPKTAGWPARLALRLETALKRHRQIRELGVLRIKEARLRSMVDRLPACVIRLSPQGEILATNTVGLSMLGASTTKQLLRQPFERLVAADGREAWREYFARICAGEQRSLEIPVTGLAGAERILEASSVPVPAELGKPMSVLMVLRDVTDRKRLEASVEDEASARAGMPPAAVPSPLIDPAVLRQLGADFERLSGHARKAFEDLGGLLRDAETHHEAAIARQLEAYTRLRTAEDEHQHAYDDFVQHAVHGVLRVSPQSRIVYANAALAGMLGYESPDELLAAAETVDVLTGAEAWRRAVETWQEGGEPVELIWRRKDRRPIALRLQGRAVADAGEGEVRVEVIAEDVSAQRTLERKLRLARRWEEVARVTIGIAADLSREIEVAHTASAQLCQPRHGEAPAGATDLAGATTRALALSRQLVAFGRREAREVERLDLNRIVMALEPLARRLVDEHVELTVDLAPALEATAATRKVVEEAVLGLTVAALDALPAGGRLDLATSSVEVDRDDAGRWPGVEPGAYLAVSLTAAGWGASADGLAEPASGTAPGVRLSSLARSLEQIGAFLRVGGEPGASVELCVLLPQAEAEGTRGGGEDGSEEIPPAAESVVRF